MHLLMCKEGNRTRESERSSIVWDLKSPAIILRFTGLYNDTALEKRHEGSTCSEFDYLYFTMEVEKTSGKELILFTAGFPFGNGESFLETELVYLSKAFDKVTIFHAEDQGLQRSIPENCALQALPKAGRFQKSFFASLQLFNRLFWKECASFRKREGKSISFLQAKIALVSLFRAREIQKILERHCPEQEDDSRIFYSYWCDDSALALSLRKTGKRVCRVHGWDLYFEANESNYLPFRSLIGHGLDAVMPISDKGLSYIKERWDINNPSRIFVQRLGVVPQEDPVHGNQSEMFQLVSCSSVIALKRVDLIAEALRLLPDDRQLHWTHFGDGIEMEKLSHAVARIGRNIECTLKGSCSNREVLEWYRETRPDLFINVSTTEGIPVSIMEAMSFSTPVIATNVGGTPEIVNETNGALVDVSITASALALEIQKWIDCEENEIKAFRNSALKTWEFDYNAEKNYTEFVKQLKAL